MISPSLGSGSRRFLLLLLSLCLSSLSWAALDAGPSPAMTMAMGTAHTFDVECAGAQGLLRARCLANLTSRWLSRPAQPSHTEYAVSPNGTIYSITPPAARGAEEAGEDTALRVGHKMERRRKVPLVPGLVNVNTGKRLSSPPSLLRHPSSPRPPAKGKKDKGRSPQRFLPAKLTRAETSEILEAYYAGNQSIAWLTTQLGYRNYVERHLGLSRHAREPRMPRGMRRAIKNANSAILQILLDATQLARSIREYTVQLQLHSVSVAATAVPNLLNSMLLKDDRTTGWFVLGASISFINILTHASPVLFLPGMVASVALNAAGIWGKPIPPMPTTRLGWQAWATLEVGEAVDALYEAYTYIFTDGSPPDLRTIKSQFDQDKVRLDPPTFLYQFRVTLVQRLINHSPLFSIYRCDGPTCRDGCVVGSSQYKIQMYAKAREYMDSLPVDWSALFSHRDGWDLVEKQYTCRKSFFLGIRCDGPPPFEYKVSVMRKLLRFIGL